MVCSSVQGDTHDLAQGHGANRDGGEDKEGVHRRLRVERNLVCDNEALPQIVELLMGLEILGVLDPHVWEDNLLHV